MTSESPSALLERAAARLADVAAGLTCVPWRIHDFAGESVVVGKPSEDRKTWRTIAGEGLDPMVAEWIAMMGPQLAPAMAELLRDAAKRAEAHPHPDPSGSTVQRCALRLARRMLGEHTEEDSRG